MPDRYDRLRLRYWGVRGSIPTPEAGFLGIGGNTSCVEVAVDGGPTLILDAGTGIRGLGHRLAWGDEGTPRDIHLVLSHFHWDHIQGLPFIGPLYGAGFRVTIYGWGDEQTMRRTLSGQMCAPYYPVPFDQLEADVRLVGIAPGEAIEIGGLTVHPFQVRHTQPTLGFRVEGAGAAIVYATDHEHGDAALDAGLVRAAEGADLLICDSQYTPDEYEARRGWGHTTWECAAGFAADAGAARLALFHHDPTHDDETLAHILADARRVFPATTLATEGTEVEFGG